MKLRFLALLAAVATGSAAVLIYASSSRHEHTANATNDAADDCSSCAMSTAKPEVAKVSAPACCADEAIAKPEIATLSAAGCPYVAGEKTAAVAAIEPAASSTDACCAAEAAAPAVAAKEAQ